MALTKKKKLAVGLLALVAVGAMAGVAAASSGRKGAPDDDDDDDDDDSPSVLAPPSADQGIDLDALPPQPGADDDDDDDDPRSDVQSPGWPQPPSQPPAVNLPIPGIVNTGGGATPPLNLPVDVVIPPSALPVDIPSVLPGVTLPPVTIPQVPEAPQVPFDVPGVDVVGLNLTNAMVTELRAAERTRNWKRPYQSVEDWQRHYGRTVDSKFGPKDALFLATLTGNVPVVRYWPQKDGVNPKRALQDYKSAMSTIANAKTGAHADQLRASIARERGQSFGPPTGTGGQAPIM